MFEKLASVLHAEISEDEAMRHAHEINRLEWRYSYKNYHKSARYCAEALRKIGLADVEIIPHPADGVTTYMDCIMPMAWDVEDARLEIVHPGGGSTILADWKENPFCVAQWSAGTGPRGAEAEVVTEEEMWAGANVRGRIVLNATDHHPRQIKKAVAERGGVGVVSDWTERYLDTPDGIYWNNEWSQGAGGWYGGLKADEESPIWCISITPRTGARLRLLMKSQRLAVRLRAVIRTRLYKGALPTVTGIIPGASRKRQEILLIAHLYEPMPSDDATGAATILETLRAIQSLVKKGRIAPPQRSIRAVFMQEMHGLTAYLATHPQVRARAVAALNLDGLADPQKIGQPVTVCVNPDVQASFTDPLFRAVAVHCMAEYAPSLAWQVNPRSSDDNFICDPTIGIPINWFAGGSGKYHHNSIGDWSIVSPEILHVAMTVCGTFTYFVSTAGRNEATWLASRIVAGARSRMDKGVECLPAVGPSGNGPDTGKLLEDARHRLDYLQYVETKRLSSLKALLRRSDKKSSGYLAKLADEIAAASHEAMARTRSRVKALWPTSRKPAKPSRAELFWQIENVELLAQNMTPKRKTMGPMVNYHRIPQPLREKVASNTNNLALMWTDGRRNLLEISRMVANEADGGQVNLRGLLRFYRALARYGYLDIRYAVTLTKADIKKALRHAGLRKNDILMMHSSLSHCGPIRGGAETVIEAVMEILSPGGTLLMPTFYDNAVIGVAECGVTYKYPPDPPHVPAPWDPDKSPAYTGAVPNAFWPRKDVLRSGQPTHSVAAWGKYAEEFVRGHGPGAACCGREGPWGKMVDYDGKILHFGCRGITFFHALEDWADLGYMPTADVLMQQGDEAVTVKSAHYPEGCRGTYGGWPNKVTRKIDELKIKFQRVPLGFSDLKLVRAREFYRLLGAVEKEPDLFLCDREGCKFCTWARKQIAKKRKRRITRRVEQ